MKGKPSEKPVRAELPIGIFDSGVGGLTVYRALHDILPGERFVYLGDTARVPYGTKSLETVERYALENAEFLDSVGIKLLVVACNTASALALPRIRERLGIDVFGVIGPGARKAVRIAQGAAAPRIAVIATESTVASNAYPVSIREASEHAEILQAACPLFVPLAEENWVDEEETLSIARKYLSAVSEFKPQVLVLGCTHYPILEGVIRNVLGSSVNLVDSGKAVAEEVSAALKENGLTNIAGTTYGEGRRLCDDLDHFFVTDAAERFAGVAERFLGAAPSRLEAVEIYGADRLENAARD